MSSFCSARDAGFVLAALLCDDRELTRVQGHVTPSDEARLRALSTAGRQRGTGDKQEHVRQLLALTHPALTRLPAGLPARFAAWVARQLPRERAREVLAAAPSARAAFEPARELSSRLQRIVRFHARAQQPDQGEPS